MQTKQHKPRCPVYLHPAAATTPATIDVIQRQTGLLVIISTKPRARPAAAQAYDDSSTPWGGDAA
jgi:hypothetical protein